MAHESGTGEGHMLQAPRHHSRQHGTRTLVQPAVALGLTKTDTGGEFPKQADSESAISVTMADVGCGSTGPLHSGRPRGFSIAIAMRSITSPPVSKLRESRLRVHIVAASLSHQGDS